MHHALQDHQVISPNNTDQSFLTIHMPLPWQIYVPYPIPNMIPIFESITIFNMTLQST